MYQPDGVKTSPDFPIPDRMKAWVLGDPDQLMLREKPVPVPARAEVLVRIDAVAICATDLEIIHSGSPASIQGGLPFNRNFTPGHEYMGTVAALGPEVDEFAIGERISVEIHAGCGQCKRCRQGMYTSCLNYGKPEKGHRANGFTTDGGFAEYAVNHINTLARVPDTMSDAEATLVVTAGTSMYGLTELGGLVAGESVVVIGPGPIGLLAVAVAKALGASPVILTGTRNRRLAIGRELGADRVINVAEENARSEKPLSKRSINTTTRPRIKPRTSPGHRFSSSSAEAMAPIAAQNVTNRTRSRLTVSSGVIAVSRSCAADYFAPERCRRCWPRCRGKIKRRARASC